MKFKLTLVACLLFSAAFSQVGIGTTIPDPSSVLDVTSTSQGLLAPRMTTVQRNAITTPANSLLVYDTDLKTFYYYDTTTTSWTKINSTSSQRTNYKLVKSVTDLAPELTAGAGSTYLLQTNTYYEINGTISLAFPIDLNNAYISGLDANEDVLSFSGGTIFQGSTGGGIRNVTLKGSRAFNISGPGITSASSLLLQNTIIDGMTTSVGTISNFGIFFSNIVQFTNNTNGITYQNIGNLLLNNQGWLSTNTGTFETLTGTFGLVEKVSGFSSLNGGDVALDVSSNPTVGNGVLFGTVFSGTTTDPSGFVKKYGAGSYPGYNFTNAWTVNSPGIPRESDDIASGNIYYNGSLTGGFAQDVPDAINTAFNLGSNTTTSSNLFRADSPVNNRFRYLGKKTRSFQINATLAVRGNSTNTANIFFAFFFRKNGTTTLTPTNTVIRFNTTGPGSEVESVSISGTVELAPNDYIEIWGQRLTGNTNLTSTQLAIFSVNLNVK